MHNAEAMQKHAVAELISCYRMQTQPHSGSRESQCQLFSSIWIWILPRAQGLHRAKHNEPKGNLRGSLKKQEEDVEMLPARVQLQSDSCNENEAFMCFFEDPK